MVEKHEQAIISKIEAECESLLKDDDGVSWDLETAVLFSTEIAESSYCTANMKAVGETIADSALSAVAEKFRNSSGVDAEEILENIDTLGHVYGLDITDIRYEIEQDEYARAAYEDMQMEDYKEQRSMQRPREDRPAPPDVIEPSENEVITDMFKGLWNLIFIGLRLLVSDFLPLADLFKA